MWFRVDNRLVHGQVIEAWLPYTGARHLVVANDELATDFLRQTREAPGRTPAGVAVHLFSQELAATLNGCGEGEFCALCHLPGRASRL